MKRRFISALIICSFLVGGPPALSQTPPSQFNSEENYKPLTVLITSEYSRFDLLNGLTGIYAVANRIDPRSIRSETHVTGTLEFWQKLENSNGWPNSKTWQSAERISPKLPCYFIQANARQDLCLRDPLRYNMMGEFVLPNARLFLVPTIRLVPFRFETAEALKKGLSPSEREQLCKTNLGWNDPSGEDCVQRIVPVQGGPYQNFTLKPQVCDLRKAAQPCAQTQITVQVSLRVISFAVILERAPSSEKRDALIKEILNLASPLNSYNFKGEIKIIDPNSSAKNLSPSSNCIAEESFDPPLFDPVWTFTKKLVNLPTLNPLTSNQETKLVIADSNYDGLCTSSALHNGYTWQSSKCEYEDALLKHPFLTGLKTSLPKHYDSSNCSQLPAYTQLDHAISVAGVIFGGEAGSAASGIVPAAFANLNLVRIAGSSAVNYLSLGIVPNGSGSRSIWVFPLHRGESSHPELKDLIDNIGSNGRFVKTSNRILFIAVPLAVCSENPSVLNWQARPQTEVCGCDPACLGRIDAAIVVAPMGKDGTILQQDETGTKYHLGPGMAQLAAPGQDIVAPSFSGTTPIFRKRTGSSIAAGIAASAALLYWRYQPNFDAVLLQARILATADIEDIKVAKFVRFGKLNLTRLLLPVFKKSDEQDLTIITDATLGQEQKDATSELKFVTGIAGGHSLSNVKKDQPPCRMVGSSTYFVFDIDDDSGYRCVDVSSIIRLRITGDSSGNPIITIVYWNPDKFPLVRIDRSIRPWNCALDPALITTVIRACLTHVDNGKVVPIDLRNKDLLFPMYLYPPG